MLGGCPVASCVNVAHTLQVKTFPKDQKWKNDLERVWEIALYCPQVAPPYTSPWFVKVQTNPRYSRLPAVSHIEKNSSYREGKNPSFTAFTCS